MSQHSGNDDVSGAIIVFKMTGEMRMKWQFDTRNWCVFGSHKDCDIQIRSESIAELQALVKLEAGQFWLETLTTNSQTIVPGLAPLTKGQKIPLNNGSQFFIGNRHFGAELTNASAAVQPVTDSPRNPYIEEINRSARKKGYGSSASKSKSSRRTSLVLSGEQHMLVEATTRTELFPSSVLETPSEKVSAVLDKEATPSREVNDGGERQISRRISLSHQSEEEDEVDEEFTEESTDTASTDFEESDDDEAKPPLLDHVAVYVKDGKDVLEFESGSQEFKSTTTPLDVNAFSVGVPLAFQGRRAENDLRPQQRPQEEYYCYEKPSGDIQVQAASTEAEIHEASGHPNSFSRWPRHKKDITGGHSQTEERSEMRLLSGNVDRTESSVTRGPPTSTKVSAISKKQMAFERLSQGLPSTPMKWETGLSSNRRNKGSAIKSRTPIAVSSSAARTPMHGPSKENFPGASQNRNRPLASGSKNKNKIDDLPSKSPGIASRDINRPISSSAIRTSASTSHVEESKSSPHQVTRRSLHSETEGLAQSPRRSVLFNDFELGQGPHYSPVRVRSKSKLASITENISRTIYPQASPSSRTSAEKKLLNHVHGPPPTEKLQELGTFFYPAKEGSAQATDHRAPEVLLKNQLDNYSSGEEECVSSFDDSSSSEQSEADVPVPEALRQFQLPIDLSVEGEDSSSKDDFSSSDAVFSSDSLPASSEEIDSSQGSCAGVDEDVVEKDEESESTVKGRSPAINNVPAIPRRGSILGAMLSAAKAVSERFSMGGGSSRVSAASSAPEELGFDPEDLETASESGASDDDGTPSASSTAEADIGSDVATLNSSLSGSDDSQSDKCVADISSMAQDSAKSPKTATVEDDWAVEDEIENPESSHAQTPKTAGFEEDSTEEDELEKFRRMKYVSLRRHMKNLGLDTTGKKDVLIETLSEFLATQAEGSVTTVKATSLDAEANTETGKEEIRETEENNAEMRDEDSLESTMSHTARDTYQVRTVKELQQFMKQHNLEIPQRIKKAELIDLVIASGIDSDGNLIASQPLPENVQPSDISKRSTPRATRSQKMTGSQKEAEVEHFTPIRRSVRSKGTTKSTSVPLQSDPVVKTRKGKSTLRTPSSAAVIKTAEEEIPIRRPTRSGASSNATEQATSVQATPARRSARKRNPVPRFEE